MEDGIDDDDDDDDALSCSRNRVPDRNGRTEQMAEEEDRRPRKRALTKNMKPAEQRKSTEDRDRETDSSQKRGPEKEKEELTSWILS